MFGFTLNVIICDYKYEKIKIFKIYLQTIEDIYDSNISILQQNTSSIYPKILTDNDNKLEECESKYTTLKDKLRGSCNESLGKTRKDILDNVDIREKVKKLVYADLYNLKNICQLLNSLVLNLNRKAMKKLI